ncbi:MAG: response regulator transcription factor [Pseudomonadota bacterium]
MTRILIADDDPGIREVTAFALDKAGMQTMLARDGAEALALFGQHRPDLVILDIGMPEMDGLGVCQEIRKGSETPVLFLTARDDEIDRVLGLEIGGDDYVTKPFSPRELVARVKVILRRTAQKGAAEAAPQMLARGRLALDCALYEAAFAGQPLALTALEFAILKALVARPEQVFTRAQIMAAAYGPSIHVSDRTIDSHIRNIRAKLAEAGCTDAIRTVHSIGFRIEACEPA